MAFHGVGAKFRNLLRKFYNVEYIVTSANGKWFSAADVVANLLVCQKKLGNDCSPITFVATKKQLPDADIDEMAVDILSNASDSNNAYINVISEGQLSSIDSLNIGWTSCFGDISWFLENLDKFEMLSTYVAIARGERRGWNPLFYPSQEGCQRMEAIFLKPVLRTLQGKYGLTVSADEKAFCCPYSLDKLQAGGYTGALAWIEQFKNQRNDKGKPLPEVLTRHNLEWYEMDASTMADFVLSMNPDNRLFISKTKEPTFVDQRLIRLTRKNKNLNSELLHALLNSCISIFLIEAIGFGRGLGVLDINSTKINDGFRIPKLDLFSPENASRIIEAFKPLLGRKVLPIYEEITQADRQKFDKTILASVGFPEEVCYKIYSALMTIYNIRKSVGK